MWCSLTLSTVMFPFSTLVDSEESNLNLDLFRLISTLVDSEESNLNLNLFQLISTLVDSEESRLIRLWLIPKNQT